MSDSERADSLSATEIQKLVKVVNRSGTHRCVICNRVNTEAIATNLGDYDRHEYFTNDPKDPSHFICITCEEIIQDLRDDYAYMDRLKEEMNENTNV